MSKSGPIDHTDTKMWGHVLIKDVDTGEVLADQHNAIHYEGMSITLAKGLAGLNDGNIHEMHFGSGGSTVSGTGTITYFPPNTLGVNADLYNPTYYKVVNNLSSLNTDPSQNYLEVKHLVGTVYSDIIVYCTLDYSEPSGQEAFDDVTNLESDYVFDEIALKAYNPNLAGGGRMLSHVIFSPIAKALNRKIEIIYTIRISVV